jgi:hypothetical protein
MTKKPEPSAEELFRQTQPSLAEDATQALPGNLPAAGTRLGRYLLLEPLGSGGMGVVYRARDEKLERIVAVKILSGSSLVGEEARRHFRREALALAKLNYSHIAAVYDVGEQDGIDYIVMELVQGESLASRLKSGPLSVKEATSVVLQIAEALEEAHEQGVIHRDLKPANIMLTSKGQGRHQVKVLDFGIAKLLTQSVDATATFDETRGVLGTPLYMSPDQVLGKPLDGRTDLWSLGVLYFEALTGSLPFNGDSVLAVMRSVTEQPLPPIRELCAGLPAEAEAIVARSLQKDPAKRYQSAAELARDLTELQLQLTAPIGGETKPVKRIPVWFLLSTSVVVIALVAVAVWQYRRFSQRQWAHEQAIPQIGTLLNAKKSLAAFLLLQQAQRRLPDDPQLRQFAEQNTLVADITSVPAGASVAIQDYLTPDGQWLSLGVTPLSHIRIPNGYFRWKVAKAGSGEITVAPDTSATMNFDLAAAQKAPPGMVYASVGSWSEYIAFIGWFGPFKLPPYYIDRNEVTNREYQQFIDQGGYTKRQYWPDHFSQNGHEVPWEQAMAQFRDTTDRPGPSTWAGGHFPDGQADFPVSGISWFEASAYARYAGKQLPVAAQFFEYAPPNQAEYTIAVSNISTSAPAPVGAFKGVGPFGTYDMAGNVREWIANTANGDSRFILGGSWKSPSYLYADPEALSPFDRSSTNGFRCVRNLGPMPENATEPVQIASRDFAKYKPANDEVFAAYKLLYNYPDTPLNARVEGVVKEMTDWREEKVTFDAAYNHERMAAYLFLPKNVKQPYQTVLFFPSARVMFLPPNSSELGDIKFFDYILQSGRAVLYPVYEDTYERRLKYSLPGGSQNVSMTSEWYKDAARSLDYLATRKDIDSSKLA